MPLLSHSHLLQGPKGLVQNRIIDGIQANYECIVQRQIITGLLTRTRSLAPLTDEKNSGTRSMMDRRVIDGFHEICTSVAISEFNVDLVTPQLVYRGGPVIIGAYATRGKGGAG